MIFLNLANDFMAVAERIWACIDIRVSSIIILSSDEKVLSIAIRGIKSYVITLVFTKLS